MESFAYRFIFVNLAQLKIYDGHTTSNHRRFTHFTRRCGQFFAHHPRSCLQLVRFVCSSSDGKYPTKHFLFDHHFCHCPCHFFTRHLATCVGHKKIGWHTDGDNRLGYWFAYRVFLWPNRIDFRPIYGSFGWRVDSKLRS